VKLERSATLNQVTGLTEPILGELEEPAAVQALDGRWLGTFSNPPRSVPIELREELSSAAAALRSLESEYYELRRARFVGGASGTRIRPSVAAKPTIDVHAGSKTMRARAEVAGAFGIDFADLKETLAKLGKVHSLAKLGNCGPLLASLDRCFNRLFGRDPIEMAFGLGPDFPDVIRATIMRHFSLQGQRFVALQEQEDGRSLHEHGVDERVAMLIKAGWAFPYFGAIDTTPLDLILVGKYMQMFPGSHFYDEEVIMDPLIQPRMSGQTIRESMVRGAKWILGRMDDPRGGGYLFNAPLNLNGIKNQVFRDSGTSYPLEPPYAPVEVQGYAYDALITVAEMLEREPASEATRESEKATARLLRERAAELRERFMQDFAIRDEAGRFSTFDHAIKVEDGKVIHADWVTSSAGRLLDSRILDGDDPRTVEMREALIARLFAPDMLGPFGLRTLSNDNAAYDPVSYHKGTSWAPDTMAVVRGLLRHHKIPEAVALMKKILLGCAEARKVGYPYPEWLPGEPGLRFEGAGVEAPPTKRQGWTATAVWACLRILSELRAEPEPQLHPEAQ
jgi:glycogen debranching enzyme